MFFSWNLVKSHYLLGHILLPFYLILFIFIKELNSDLAHLLVHCVDPLNAFSYDFMFLIHDIVCIINKEFGSFLFRLEQSIHYLSRIIAFVFVFFFYYFASILSGTLHKSVLSFRQIYPLYAFKRTWLVICFKWIWLVEISEIYKEAKAVTSLTKTMLMYSMVPCYCAKVVLEELSSYWIYAFTTRFLKIRSTIKVFHIDLSTLNISSLAFHWIM